MERYIRSTPKIDDPSRYLFEEAEQSQSIARKVSVQVDTMIDSIHHVLSNRDSDVPLKEVFEEFKVMKNRFVMSRIHEVFSTDTWTDISRALAILEFAEARLLAPFYYSHQSSYEGRKMIANGTLGSSAAAIDLYLQAYDSTRVTKQDRKHLRGVLNEHTTMALLNFNETPSQIAVPSSTYDDIYNRTDMYLFRREKEEDGSRHGYRYPISVKSKLLDAKREKQQHPEDIVVSAYDIANENLETSRLIVRHLNGAPGLSDAELLYLKNVQAYLQEHVLSQTESAPRIEYDMEIISENSDLREIS